MNKNSLELFSLLSENSHVTDEQMQNAYILLPCRLR